jgi:hypothetical protein
MTKPINLRQVRKRKAREDKAKQAETNRMAHGQLKTVTDLAKREADIAKRNLDGKKLNSEDSSNPEE